MLNKLPMVALMVFCFVACTSNSQSTDTSSLSAGSTGQLNIPGNYVALAKINSRDGSLTTVTATVKNDGVYVAALKQMPDGKIVTILPASIIGSMMNRGRPDTIYVIANSANGANYLRFDRTAQTISVVSYDPYSSVDLQSSGSSIDWTGFDQYKDSLTQKDFQTGGNQ